MSELWQAEPIACWQNDLDELRRKGWEVPPSSRVIRANLSSQRWIAMLR